ncbi:MAG: hypothetical protein LRY71_15015 [Bacillaceae bacterium]|nr:hypothetical protein [Bacillaceae bacterium]
MLKDLKPLLAQMDRSIQIQEPEGTLTGDDAVVTNSLEGLSKDNKESAQILPEWPKGNDSLLKQQLTSNIILQQLITRSKEIGFQYEKDLVSLLNENEFKSKSEHLMGQLKPLLIEALELTLSVELMKKLETVLQRITGQQLLSTEQYGPVHQISYTLPIKLGAFETDVNIQWEAKRKENGKLDESHCRIIFYLHLLHLNEVMIDVQVQNRIISIHVFNEFEHPVPLTNSLQPFLKEALQTMNYQLSSLKWTKVSETAQQKGKKAQTVPKAVYENRLYKGVDFRV